MKFNINECVRIRLTDKGREIHKAAFAVVERITGRYTAPKEDSGGWCEMQLWTVMELFGPHIYMGCENPFETEIDILIKSENSEWADEWNRQSSGARPI
jgi:hypothetical protein